MFISSGMDKVGDIVDDTSMNKLSFKKNIF